MTRIFLLMPAMLLSAPLLWGHDLSSRIEKAGPAVIVEVTYAGDEAVGYAEVLVYSPADSDVEYQNGRTDANGFFSFVPDRSGEWLFVVDDEEGHRLELPIEVDAAAASSGGGQITASAPTWQKLITGVSFILGITGLLLWWKARQGLRQDARS